MPETIAQPVEYTWEHRLSTARFAIVHLVCLGAIWTGVSLRAALLAVALYALRMFAVTAGYHRYFSHRAYKMGRVTRFIMGFLAQSTGQKSVLWWASMHRHHHRFSDKPQDVHSPTRGFWWSHVGWILSPTTRETRFEYIKDLSSAPELMWLHRWQYTPAIVLAALCLAFAGPSGLIVGFFWSTVALYHATFTINSLSHVFGSQRYDTGDLSRNNLWLALLTFGEGWHNNHHHYQLSVRQGFHWWEVDLTYYALCAMEKVGLVWDMRRPPQHVVEGTAHPAAPPRGEDAAPASVPTVA